MTGVNVFGGASGDSFGLGTLHSAERRWGRDMASSRRPVIALQAGAVFDFSEPPTPAEGVRRTGRS